MYLRRYTFRWFVLALVAFSLVACSSVEVREGKGQKWAGAYLSGELPGNRVSTAGESGFVPDAETAINLAVSAWEPIYGKENIAGQKPYYAYEARGHWVVHGSLPPPRTGYAMVRGEKVSVVMVTVGGTAHAIIEKETGKVIHIIHYK